MEKRKCPISPGGKLKRGIAKEQKGLEIRNLKLQKHQTLEEIEIGKLGNGRQREREGVRFIEPKSPTLHQRGPQLCRRFS